MVFKRQARVSKKMGKAKAVFARLGAISSDGRAHLPGQEDGLGCHWGRAGSYGIFWGEPVVEENSFNA